MRPLALAALIAAMPGAPTGASCYGFLTELPARTYGRANLWSPTTAPNQRGTHSVSVWNTVDGGNMSANYSCPFKVQRSVTLSSAEAEFFGAMLALKDVLWLRQLLLDLDLLVPGPTLMWCDAKSAVDMAFDPVAFKNTKHILRAAEFLKNHTLRGSCRMQHCKGIIMIADILTKGVARPLFLQLLKLLDDYAANSIADLHQADE